MKSLRDHVDDLLRCRLACNQDLAYTVRTRKDNLGGVTVELLQKLKGSDPYVIATYHVNHELRVRRLMGSTSTQTPDAQELEALLRLDIEERVGSILALLTERGSV